MSTVTTTFFIDKLDDLAEKFEVEAAENRQNSVCKHFTIRDRKYYEGRAESLAYVATIIRRTKIKGDLV